MKKLTVLLLSAVTGMVSCGQQNATEGSDLNIVGGRNVKGTDAYARHVVSLTNYRGQTFCTGTLVGKQLVLTAAHCVTGGQKFVVGFGINEGANTIRRDQIRKVVKVALNKNYSLDDNEELINQADLDKKGKMVSDLALIKTDAPAPRGWVPAKLLPPQGKLRRGQGVYLIGYGVTATPRDGVEITSAKDLFDSKKIKNDAGTLRTVGSRYNTTNKLGEFVIGPTIGKGVCSGDSGGPAFVAVRSKSGKPLFYQIGVASRSDCRGTAWYTDVRAHYDWIARARAFVNKNP